MAQMSTVLVIARREDYKAVEQDEPFARAFALVGAARHDHGGFKLEDLAEHITEALETREWVKLGFYDWGYRQSVYFWPRTIEDQEGFQRTSMRAFSGEIGAPAVEPKFPACLVITEHDGKTEAVITWLPTGLHSFDAGEA